jgi:Domain of unknown function (DUF4145)
MLDRNLLASTFSRTEFPKLPCPRCKKGQLRLEPATLIIADPEYNAVGHSHPDWEPDWLVERFSAHLKCDDSKCGERGVMSGDSELVEIDEDDGSYGLESMLRPQSLFPAVALIDIPEAASYEVRTELWKSFGQFWTDIDAAANRVRVAIERLLDQLKVGTTTVNKHNKVVDLDLNGRIDRFAKTNPEFKEALHGLRMMGNLGSHGTGVNREVFLDGLEMLEDALSDLIGGKKNRMKAIAQMLVASKGKKSS